jgi:hypothetical protein
VVVHQCWEPLVHHAAVRLQQGWWGNGGRHQCSWVVLCANVLVSAYL